jgi:integrase
MESKKSFKRVVTFYIAYDPYIVKRQEEGAKNTSINRKLSFLKRAFSLATKQTPAKVSNKPHIPMLRESNARAGFFEHEQYLALRDVLPDYVRPIFIMGYYTGMRLNEIVSLEWPQVNLSEGKVTLNPGTTKNDEARIVFLSGELLDAIHQQKAIHDKFYPSCQWVFSYKGQQIKRFTRSWKTACKASGLEGMIFHDCQRTAVRNMVNSMIPERVCMKITGHKTRSIFDRYHIINEDDLKRASLIVSEWLQNKEEELSRAQNGHSDKNNVVNTWR